MGISAGGIGDVRSNAAIATTRSGEPNWSYIPTAGKTNKSKTEFICEIKELAQKAALSVNKTESEYISRQVLQLNAEYLSDVAPDRKRLYQQAKNAMKNQDNAPKGKGMGELTLLDFLEAADGRGSSLAEKRFALAGGGTLTCPILTGGGYGAVIEYQGVKALSNTGYGWSYEMTPAEIAKKNEFYFVYWTEYRSVKNSAGAELETLPDYLEDKPAFDRKA
ncbi:MAG: hypothetical protein NC347_14930 [Clostridium sp.]|nr:hypothetical protein [Clostridium sp.]